ncbi:MAG TPA: ferredoxin--NADP reductase [Gammaproteobacteria bacterium]|nr:ferredoxin--NADP reductase [Gammaproteobacteria bacterium]
MGKDIDSKRWSTGRVRELHPWTDKLFSIRIDADTDPFTAGQFTKLGLVIGDEFISRPYSYVNAPGEEPLEFYFVTVPDGPLTGAMLELRPGDSIYVMRKAAGFLTLNEVPAAEQLWMLSSGTAIGPFLSMLKTREPWQTYQSIVLVHAVRLAGELSFQDTIAALGEQHPGQFSFIPFVSREDTDFAIRARIPAAIEDGRLEQRAGLEISPQRSQVMICGNPDMVKSTQAVLETRGLTRNRRRTPGHITVENYW